MVTTTEPPVAWQLKTVVPVWLLTVVAGVLIGLLSPQGQFLTWLPIALAAAVLLTFCLQLATLRKEGFVNRVMASLGGAVVILGIATAVLGTLAVTSG
jgi:hypothetical protein